MIISWSSRQAFRNVELYSKLMRLCFQEPDADGLFNSILV